MGFAAPSSSTVRFGVFEFDRESGELRKNGLKLKLQGQPILVLEQLLEARGRMVSREELRKKLWPADTYVDFEHGLNAAMQRLREALEDSAENPRFIETVPRRGYRFIAPTQSHLPEAPLPGREVLTWLRVWPKAHSKAIALSALLGLIGAGALVAAFVVGQRLAEKPPPSFHPLTFGRGQVRSARFAADGHTVIYSAAWGGQPAQLFLTRVGRPESLPLELRDAELLSLSRSGEMALLLHPKPFGFLVSTGTLAHAPLAGGAPREILRDVQGADWSPDGSQLAVARAVGGRRRLEFPLGNVLYETSGWISRPRVAPDGNLVAFFDHPFPPTEDRGSLAVVDRLGNKKALSDGWVSLQGLAWATKGDEIWFTGSKAGAAHALYAMTLSGQQRLIAQQAGGLRLHDVSRDGRLLMAHENISMGVMALPPGETREKDLSWFDLAVSRDLSRDGKTLLFAEEGDTEHYGVYLRKTDGSAPVRLGEGLPYELSPDGEWTLSILHTSPAPIVLLPTGAGEMRRLENGGLDHLAAGWFPDGEQIVFVARAPGEMEPRLYVQALKGGEPKAISSPKGIYIFRGAVSPDGKFVAACDLENIWLYPAEGGEPLRIARLDKVGRPIGWTADGRALYVYRVGPPPTGVYRLNITTGQMTPWKEIMPPDPDGVVHIFDLIVTPDGESYAYTYLRILSQLYLVERLR